MHNVAINYLTEDGSPTILFEPSELIGFQDSWDFQREWQKKLILNPSSGAPGFYLENVFCLPGVPSILKSMIGGLNNLLVGGDPILSKTINLRTYESEIAKSLTDIQNKNKEVEIGSYPFFRAGKLGVSIVLRSTDQDKIDECNDQILKFVIAKDIEVLREI